MCVMQDNNEKERRDQKEYDRQMNELALGVIVATHDSFILLCHIKCHKNE